MSDEPTLALHSDGLLSKWGFNDGDTPDNLLDYCDAHGLDYPVGWRRLLYQLVAERLVPALDQEVTITYIVTNHNPVRALTVDGVDVRAEWYDGDARTALTPPSVEVTMADVIAMAQQVRP